MLLDIGDTIGDDMNVQAQQTNAESQAQSVRSEQGRLGEGENHTRGEAGVGTPSQRDERFYVGTAGTSGQGADGYHSVTGGIVAQLVKQAEDQLGNAESEMRNAEECIEWYEREKSKHQKQVHSLQQRLKELRQLQQLVEQETK